jgi:PAS domain S-box-containing protein
MREGKKTKIGNKLENDFLVFFDNIPDGVILADIQTKKIYYGNKAIGHILGCSREKLKRMKITDLHPRSEMARVLSDFGRLARREISVSENVPVKGGNGRIIYVDINASIPVVFKGKKMMIGFFRDVTSRKLAEEELSLSKQHLTDLVDYLPDATMAIDLDRRVIAWSHKMEQLTGVKKNNILGKDNHLYSVPFYGKRRSTLIDLVLKKDNKIRKLYPYVNTENDRLVSEMFLPHLNGGRGAYLWFVASPLYNKKGQLVGAIESVRDITDHKLAEQELLKSQERFKNLVDLLPQTVFEIDKNCKLTFINHHGLSTFGFTKKDFAAGLNIFNMIAPQDRKRAATMIMGRTRSKKQGANEYLALRKDGSTFPIMIYSSPSTQEKKSGGISGILIDLSSVRKAEQSFQEVAAKDEALLGSIADGVVAIDKERKIILINQTALRLLNCTEKEAMGKKWFEIIHKEDENGNVIPPKLSAFERALKTGQISDSVTPYYYAGEKGKKFPISRAVSPVILGGETIGAIDVFRDISYEKQLDKAKDDFLSLASHQLRTPLSASKWILEMFLQSKGLNDKQKEYLRDLGISNDQLISLVNDLLDVTRIEAGKLPVNKKLADILSLIRAAIELAKPNLAKKNQQVNFTVSAKVESTIVDPLLFSEAFKNLLSNACDFAPEKGIIDIQFGADKKEYVISVRNFGSLIPAADQPKVFSKFYRGQNAQEVQHVGSGLGLFITKSAVEANGGRIWFESNVEDGTIFYFTVPRQFRGR